MYRLKPGVPDFEIMDGPDRGKRFTADQLYPEVPKDLEKQFIAVDTSDPPAASYAGKPKTATKSLRL